MSKRNRKKLARRPEAQSAAPVQRAPAAEEVQQVQQAPQAAHSSCAPGARSFSQTSGLPFWDFRTLRQRADSAYDAKRWSEVLELGRTPPEQVHGREALPLADFLAMLRVEGLTQGHTLSYYHLPEPERQELLTDLRWLAQSLPDFAESSFLHLFVHSLPWNAAGCLEAYDVLLSLGERLTSADTLRALRQRGLWLHRVADEAQDFVSADECALAQTRPDILSDLERAYLQVPRQGLSLPEQALLEVFVQEIRLLQAQPWEREPALAEVRALAQRCENTAQALAEALAKSPENPGLANTRAALRDWLFLWELYSTGPQDWPALLERYARPLSWHGHEAVRRVLSACAGAPDAAQDELVLATEGLAAYVEDESGGYLGMLTLCEGPPACSVYAGNGWLEAPSVEVLLLRLLESMPSGHPCEDQLHTLYLVLQCRKDGNATEIEGAGPGLERSLEELSLRSPGFSLMVAYVLSGARQGVVYLVRGLAGSLELGLSPFSAALFVKYAWEEAESEEAQGLLDELTKLLALRERMSEETARHWRSALESVLRVLCNTPSEQMEKAYQIVAALEDDVRASKNLFFLGYFAQVTGRPVEAARAYLEVVRTEGRLGESLQGNLLLLWRKTKELATLQALNDELDRAQGMLDAAGHKGLLEAVAQEARALTSQLESAAQFERTAVDRWPALSGQARKLLGVLHRVQSYNGWDELGRYAGMEPVWVERHYRRLVETGMLLVSGSTYRVNEYICPLLERESQHSVIARIVRANGSSGIKPVFNSQREFNIYQILVQLCPNHLVFPNCALQAIMSYDKMKELVSESDFGYYLRASVDVVVVSSTSYLPMLAVEVDSVWHDTERQQGKDESKDRLFAAAGVPLLRLRPVGSPSEQTIRGQVAEHLNDLVQELRTDLPGYDQARSLLESLAAPA